MAIAFKACPKCIGDLEFDIIEEEWLCLNCGWRGYPNQATVLPSNMRADDGTAKD